MAIDPAMIRARMERRQPATAGSQTSSKLDAARDRLKRDQSILRQQQDALRALRRPNPKDTQAMARYNATVSKYNKAIAASNTSIKALQKQIPGLQNKVYEETGQWDKLLTGANSDSI